MLQANQDKLNGDRVGVVFGSFAPLHQGHLDLIFRAKKENSGGAIVVVCGVDGDKGEPYGMLHNKRYRYVREFFADDPLVAVYGINDTELGLAAYPNGWDGWMQEFERIFNIAVVSPETTKRKWYVGDENYYTDLVEREHEDAVLIDRKSFNPICATMIRQNPIKNWDKITAPFRRVFSTNILITGTASEGKSTLVQDLAKYFNAPCSYEYGKDYVINSAISDWELDLADFLAFLEGQYNLNKQMINSPGNHGIFFSDTDSLVTNMYAQQYAKEPNFVLNDDDAKRIKDIAYEYAKKSRWDKIFLILPHDKFVDDNVRCMVHSDLEIRKTLCNTLIESIKDIGDWDKVHILDGTYYENFMTVVNYVKEIIENGKN